MLLAMKLHWSPESIGRLAMAEVDFYVDELTKAMNAPS